MSKAKPPSDSISQEVPLHLLKASANLDWKTRFRIIASKASRRNRNPSAYSVMEVPIRNELNRLGFVEGVTFIHEYKIFGYNGKKGQKVYYWIDFFLPELNLGIEADGEVWHQFFDLKKRDRIRDHRLLQIYGTKVVRFSSFDMHRGRLRRKLLRVMMRRVLEQREPFGRRTVTS